MTNKIIKLPTSLNMSQLEISIVKLQDELKTANKTIVTLLQERDAIKKAYSMQIDLVEALENKINSLQSKLNQVQ